MALQWVIKNNVGPFTTQGTPVRDAHTITVHSCVA